MFYDLYNIILSENSDFLEEEIRKVVMNTSTVTIFVILNFVIIFFNHCENVEGVVLKWKLDLIERHFGIDFENIGTENFKNTLIQFIYHKERMYRCVGLLHETIWNFNFNAFIEFKDSQCLIGVPALFFDTSVDFMSLFLFMNFVLRVFHYGFLVVFLTIIAPL